MKKPKVITNAPIAASTIWELTKRNILIFLKNKSTVIFSFLAPVLILVFYILFLGDLQVKIIFDQIPKDVNITVKEVKPIVDSWLVSGVVSIACLTISLNSMFVIIADKEKKTIHDFVASPLNNVVLLTSYFLASFILTFTLCFLVLVIGVVFVGIAGGLVFTFVQLLELLLILFLSCLSAVMVMLCIMSLFKTNAASSAFNGVFSALIGFMIGAYLPVSILPVGAQNFANLIPGSYSTGLFRNVFISKAMSRLPAETLSSVEGVFNDVYSMNLKLFGLTIDKPIMYALLAASIVVFFLVYLLINYIQNKLKKNQ